jgi:RNA polymerase sigma-70 factor (ECF subfamily)
MTTISESGVGYARGLDMTDRDTHTAFGELLSAVLADLAAEPVLLLGGTAVDGSARGALRRISVRARSHTDAFHTLLVTVFQQNRSQLTGYVVKKAGRDLAEDVVQTAFMRVFARRPEVADAEGLRRYLWTTVKNVITDEFRRAAAARERTSRSFDERAEQLCAESGLPFEDRFSLRRSLVNALNGLSPREREAVVLRYYADYSVAQTAQIMGVSAGAVKSYTSLGVDRAKAGLQRLSR